MKKNLSRILAAFLVLCMLPATFITAFARGKGVVGDDAENQSIINAPGQYIPETIKVDGVLNDTGWPESGFNYVDGNTGFWSPENLTGKNGEATYKYQIRSDIEQIYVGATVTVPELVSGQTEYKFWVFLKDPELKDPDGNDYIGYTDDIVFTVNVATKTATAIVGPNNAESTVESGALPAEAHQFAYDFSDDGKTVTLELRNMLKNMFVCDISKVTYYVALYLPTGNGDSVDQLVHPKVAYNGAGTALVPTFDYWPADANGDALGKHVTTLNTKNDDSLPPSVTVDGKFDEDVWSSLTNYYIHDEEADGYNGANDYASLNGDTQYGTGVKYSTGSYIPTGTGNSGVLSGYDSGDTPNRTNISFKYEFRVDGKYLYGAVVAYVPPIQPYKENDNSIDGGKDVWVYTSPDLNIFFFDDERAAIKEYNLDSGEYVTSTKEPAAGDSAYDILPESEKVRIESLLQIRSNRPDFQEGGKVYSSYANCWVDRANNNLPYHIAWAGAAVNVYDKTQFEGSRSECQPGNLWNFEFKVALDRIPRVGDVKGVGGDICFSIAVYDRYSINRSGTSLRGCAYTGSANGQTYSQRVPQYNYSGNENNKITAAQIAAASANSLDVANKNNFGDKAELQQEIWAALSGADNAVDGRLKNTTALNSNSSFAYKLSADYEYLYGAVLLSDSWKADSWLKLVLNRKKTYEEFIKMDGYEEQSTGIPSSLGGSNLKIIQRYDVTTANGQSVREWKNGKTTYDDNRTKLNDGALAGGTWTPDNNVFAAWERVVPQGATGKDIKVNFDLTLTDVFSTNTMNLYFGGGNKDAGNDGLWGIYLPKTNIEVWYSETGNDADYKKASGTLTTETYYNDINPNDNEFVGKIYKIKLDDYISAKKIRLVIQGVGGFVFLSEVNIYVPETANEYYGVNMRLSDAKNSAIYHNQTVISNTLTENDFDYKVVKYGNGNSERAVEFKIPLDALGIDCDLSAEELQEIFAYYISVEEASASGVQHPRNNSGDYIKHDDENRTLEWKLLGNNDGHASFTYGDMLDNIVIDGKLEEKYWIGEGVEMQHVDSTNGSWKNEPTKGNSFSYDYRVYATENYLYGAAIIDVSAIKGSTAYDAYLGTGNKDLPVTRFDIWIDNQINEYEWISDSNSKTNINFVSKKSDLPDPSAENNFNYGQNGSHGYEFQYYTNYYYNIYLCDDDSLTVKAGMGDTNVCGGSSPSRINDPALEANDPKLSKAIDESNWSWGMSTVNGVTYVEFMIKLDNVYCDPSKGINYFVSATHPFGTETADTSDDETLTLVYPAIKAEGISVPSQPLWVTHTNWSTEGAGVIFTTEYMQTTKYTNPADKNTWNTDSKLWWYFALLRPVNGSSNTYKIVEIRKYIITAEETKLTTPFLWGETLVDGSTIQTGDIVYGINSGNDYIGIQKYKDSLPAADVGVSGKDKYAHITAENLLPEKHGGKNYMNDQCDEMMRRFERWKEGDVLTLDLSSEVRNALANRKTESIEFGQTGVDFDGSGDIINLKWYDPSYISDNAYVIKSRSEATLKAEVAARNSYLPTTGSWDTKNDASIKALTHFAPEVINIDGKLNEAGWDNNRWISVYETVNGTSLKAEGVAESLKNKEIFKYQIRTDGEYLYVGAKYSDVAYNAEDNPSFKLWIKNNEASATWTHLYEVAFGNGSAALEPQHTQISDDAYASDEITVQILNAAMNKAPVEFGASALPFGSKLNAVKNTATTPSGDGEDVRQYYNNYLGSALFGYTEEIQENQRTGTEGINLYYPEIKTEKIYLGKEGAVMMAEGDTVDVEFKIALTEFGAVATVDGKTVYNGFEYYVQASYKNEDVFYPVVCAETEEGYRYNSFPNWRWDSKNSAKVTADDIKGGAIRMRNNCMPVVTLGAKITDNCVVNGQSYKAIRFGALYNEDYLRNWRKTDAQSVEKDNEMYTAITNDYWDVANVGIIILPTDILGSQELKLETPRIANYTADNIVNWQKGKDVNGWSNFADYENFVFYVTMINIPVDRKLSFRPYVDFYASAGTDSAYGETFIRSYNMVANNLLSEEGETEEGKPVLPDSSQNPPPVEIMP